jgi:hypothetical protein
VKSVAQQVLWSLHRFRSGWLASRTAQINTLRGLLRELGLVIPVGAEKVLPGVRTLIADADSEIPDALRLCCHGRSGPGQARPHRLAVWATATTSPRSSRRWPGMAQEHISPNAATRSGDGEQGRTGRKVENNGTVEAAVIDYLLCAHSIMARSEAPAKEPQIRLQSTSPFTAQCGAGCHAATTRQTL